MFKLPSYDVGCDAGLEDWEDIDISNAQIGMSPEEVEDFNSGYERGLELRAIRQEEIEYDLRDMNWMPTWEGEDDN